jgi:threonine/homoserine/homoserine lactone efflux protein
MNANPFLFRGLQWFGIAYICWMGFQLIRTRIENGGEKDEPLGSGFLYFRQAFTVSLTNPKVLLFFVAFFPLFLRADASPVTLGIMMAHVTVISFIYQAVLVFVGNALARKLSALPYARRVATRLAGITLIGFGIKLALGNR